MTHFLTSAIGLSRLAGDTVDRTQSEMNGIQDMIDPRQVALFDAIDQLSGLKITGDIEVPQLIVVGDQSSGKSSVLEAIARFRFPVNDQLCTRFPTKLILRRSAWEQTDFSISPGASRTEEERERLQQFKGSMSNPDEFGDWIKKAAAVLGVPYAQDMESPNIDDLRKFTDDILVVEKYGPDLPLVNLVDLPGLFQAESNEQDEASKKTVIKMVEEHIKSKRSLVLLVISARTSFHNHTGPATIQKISKHDPGLADRVIGVITSPDQALSPKETLNILSGRLDSTNLKHGWHVVKNQDQEERYEPLEQRDMKEEQFFLLSPIWREVPEQQRGIKALRATLKDMFWAHTRAELPDLVSEIQKKATVAEARLAAIVRPRSTDLARRQYLQDIARKFERLTREACQGTYQDEDCSELHRTGDDCQACKRFFARFGDDRPESQDKNLRANVRALSKAFALAMREFGKTEDIVYLWKNTKGHSQNNNNFRSTTHDASNKTQKSAPQKNKLSQEFPAQDVIDKFYVHSKPKAIDREPFEGWLATQLQRWRGREPQGEASEIVYPGLFEYQSEKWSEIASKHLDAVWQAAGRFVDLALAAACIEEDVLQALKHLIKPRLDNLEKASHRTMNDLLNCHSRGKTGFYDGFVHIEPMRRHAEDLAQRLAAMKPDYANQKDHSISSELFKEVRDAVGSAASMSVGSIMEHNLIKDAVNRMAEGTLPPAAQPEGKAPEGKTKSAGAIREAAFGFIPVEQENIAAARVIEHVETYYEVRSSGLFSALANSCQA